MKQVQEAYIVAASRTPIGKSGRGYFKNTRSDDLLVRAIQSALAQVPTLDPKAIEDAVIGCSFPEGEQGMNMARIAVALAGLPHTVGGVTINRFCASGITAIQMAADRIRVGEADVMIAGGAESMSMVPMGGNKPSFNPEVFNGDENIGIAYGMGLTAERVAESGYLSQDDGRLHFGLGTTAQIDKIIVRWPSGKEQVLDKQPVDQVLSVVEPK